MALLGAVFVTLIALAHAVQYEFLSDGSFAMPTLQPGEVKYFAYTSNNQGVPCTGDGCFPVQGTGDRFFRVQAHSQYAQLQMQLSVDVPVDISKDFVTVTGVNVGLLQKYGQWSNLYGGECVQTLSTWTPPNLGATIYFSIKFVDAMAKPLSVAVMAESHDTRPPIPGGCTTQGDYLYNPMISLVYDADTTTIAFSQADMGVTRDVCTLQCPSSICCGEHSCNCDFITDQDRVGSGTVKYEIYRSFVASCGSDFHRVVDERDVLSALAGMATVEGVLKNGHKVREIYPSDGKVLFFDSLLGQGVIYNVLVTDTTLAAQNPKTSKKVFQSVYTPVHTYACDVLSGECEKRDDFRMALCLVVAVIGLWLAITGVRYFRINLVVVAFLFWSTMGYMLFGGFTTLSWMGVVLSGAAAGLAMAGITYGLMYLFDTIGLALVLFGGSMGILLAGLVFATPLTDLRIFQNNFNYGMAFACAVIFFPVLFLLNSKFITVLSSSVIGSYCLLIGFDFFIGSEFNDLYANTLRRAIDKDWAKGYSGSYFSEDFNGCASRTLNLAFLGAWGLLSCIFCLCQYCAVARKSTVPGSFRALNKTPRYMMRFRRVRVQKKSPTTGSINVTVRRAKLPPRELRPLITNEEGGASSMNNTTDEEDMEEGHTGLSPRNPFAQ